MVLELLKYPDERIKLISGNVRFFDDSLQTIIQDMIDSMKAADLNALSAMQIGIQYSVVVIKHDDSYKPYINLRMIGHEGMAVKTERSPYYENISVDVPRFEKIKIFYEDEKGDAHYADLEGDEARMIQQQIDYCFGATFVDRVDKETRARIESHLSQGLVKGSGGSCPTVYYREYFIKAYQWIMLAVLFSFITPLFTDDTLFIEQISSLDKWALVAVPLLITAYFFYANYESKKYKQCTSCQTGNIIGTAGLALVQWLILLIMHFFIMA